MTAVIFLAHPDLIDFIFQNIDSVPGNLLEKPIPFAQKILNVFRRKLSS